MYTPCDMEEKRALRHHQLYHLFIGDQWLTWRVCDFNAIRLDWNKKEMLITQGRRICNIIMIVLITQLLLICH